MNTSNWIISERFQRWPHKGLILLHSHVLHTITQRTALLYNCKSQHYASRFGSMSAVETALHYPANLSRISKTGTLATGREGVGKGLSMKQLRNIPLWRTCSHARVPIFSKYLAAKITEALKGSWKQREDRRKRICVGWKDEAADPAYLNFSSEYIRRRIHFIALHSVA